MIKFSVFIVFSDKTAFSFPDCTVTCLENFQKNQQIFTQYTPVWTQGSRETLDVAENPQTANIAKWDFCFLETDPKYHKSVISNFQYVAEYEILNVFLLYHIRYWQLNIAAAVCTGIWKEINKTRNGIKWFLVTNSASVWRRIMNGLGIILWHVTKTVIILSVSPIDKIF